MRNTDSSKLVAIIDILALAALLISFFSGVSMIGIFGSGSKEGGFQNGDNFTGTPASDAVQIPQRGQPSADTPSSGLPIKNVHVISSILFALLVAAHLATHWGWIKNLPGILTS